MVTFEWTGRQAPDPEASGDVFVQLKVDGKSVSVHVSIEAIEDYGMDDCQAKAEEKIENILASGGEVPAKLTVRTTDFA
jgi:hypothetical protein